MLQINVLCVLCFDDHAPRFVKRISRREEGGEWATGFIYSEIPLTQRQFSVSSYVNRDCSVNLIALICTFLTFLTFIIYHLSYIILSFIANGTPSGASPPHPSPRWTRVARIFSTHTHPLPTPRPSQPPHLPRSPSSCGGAFLPNRKEGGPLEWVPTVVGDNVPHTCLLEV